jgi:N-acetylmuramoyl-L-alanine amidase
MMRMLAGLVLLLSTQPAFAALALLERIEVSGGVTAMVRLHLSAPVTPVVRALPADKDVPDRLYLDLPGTVVAAGLQTALPGVDPVVRVRTGQFGATVARVVLDLTHAVPFAVQSAGTTVTIDVGLPSSSLPRTLVRRAEPLPLAQLATPAPWTLASRPTVIVDPGHGGRDPGAAGVGGVIEKDIVLDVARRLAANLSARLRVDALLTRSGDVTLPVDRRLPPPESRAALFISLHANACRDPGPRGFEVFYGGGFVRTASSTATSVEAARLGRAIAEALGARLGPVRGGARPGAYAVLVRNPVPSVLVEIGYLTDAGDAARAGDADYRERLADALVEGVGAYLRSGNAPL